MTFSQASFTSIKFGTSGQLRIEEGKIPEENQESDTSISKRHNAFLCISPFCYPIDYKFKQYITEHTLFE